jgi:hypothetical protein
VLGSLPAPSSRALVVELLLCCSENDCADLVVRLSSSELSDEPVAVAGSSCDLVVSSGCSSVCAGPGRINDRVTGSSGLLATAKVSLKLGSCWR